MERLTWENVLTPSIYKIYNRETVLQAINALDNATTFVVVSELSNGEKMRVLDSLKQIRYCLLTTVDTSAGRTQEIDETILELTEYDEYVEEAQEIEED